MPAWTLRTYEVVPGRDLVRTTLARTVDGDPVVRHVDVPQSAIEAVAVNPAGWTDAECCTAVAAALGVGHTVTPDTPPE